MKTNLKFRQQSYKMQHKHILTFCWPHRRQWCSRRDGGVQSLSWPPWALQSFWTCGSGSPDCADKSAPTRSPQKWPNKEWQRSTGRKQRLKRGDYTFVYYNHLWLLHASVIPRSNDSLIPRWDDSWMSWMCVTYLSVQLRLECYSISVNQFDVSALLSVSFMMYLL